jgi:probable HAF family extracellular repeat protein
MECSSYGPFGPDPRSFKTDVNFSNTLLGTLPGGTSSSAFGINIFGQIVGGGDTGGGGFGHGFVYSNGQMHDLNNLLSPADAKVWLVWEAVSINDRGQIVGNAVNALGEFHAVILTPVD